MVLVTYIEKQGLNNAIEMPVILPMNNSMLSLKSIVANSSLFKMLDDAQLEQIVAGTRLSRIGADMTVINQGDVANGAFWIVYGQVKIVLNMKNGNKKILEILGENTWFGLGEMLLDRPHLALVKTTTDSMLLHTDRATILQVAEQNFAFSRELMNCVGRQLHGLVNDIESYSQTAKQRLADYLLRQSQRESSDDIELVANKALIASRLSLTPETLSRLFNNFSANGLISMSGRHIKILDYDRMSAELM